MAVLLETSIGDLVIDLYTRDSPNACKNFLKLCKQKFYNGAMLMDLQKNYLVQIQTMNPPTTIFGTQYFEDEQSQRKHDRLGVVSTSNKGPNLNNSNFFITLHNDDLPNLNLKHTIFGQIQEGEDVIKKINELFVDETNRPLLNVRIKHTVILEDPFPDPEDMKVPSRSPSPKTYKGFGRLEFEEKEDFIDKMNNRTEQELSDLANQHKSKSRAVVLEMLEDLPDADIKPPDNILFVCKINPMTEERDLEIIFAKFGPIKKCDIVRDWKTGQSLQYAFIEYETTANCEEAYLKMENAVIDERRIHVDFCQSAASQWAQLKKSQRRKQMLDDQRNNFRQNRDNNQTMIDQLEVKNDYFNTRNNFKYVVDTPQVPKQLVLPVQPLVQIEAPIIQKQDTVKTKSKSPVKQSKHHQHDRKASRRSRSRSSSQRRKDHRKDKHRRHH